MNSYFIKSNTDFLPATLSAFSKASIADSLFSLVLFVLAFPYDMYGSCIVKLNNIVFLKELV